MDIIKMVLRESLSCEAILRRAPNGDLIILSQCGGTNEPQKENRVVLLRSSDNGKTWSKPTKIYDDGRALYVSEVFVADGEIWAFALAHDGDFLGWETFLLKSFDSGYTWQKCESVWKDRAFCFIRGGIRVGDALVFPTQYYEVSDAECRRLKEKGELLLKAEIPCVKNGALISKDGGKSFYRSRTTADLPMAIDGKRLWKWSEPTLARLPDGKIVMLMRADGEGFLYRSESADGGESWSAPQKTEIPNPNNKPKLLNLADGRIALLNTPDKRIGFNYRTCLSLWISGDGLKTFAYKRELLRFPGWLSYPDGFYDERDGRIKFAFELNRHDVYFVDCAIE